MAEVYLIGTIHTDINGPDRLERRLHEIKPEIVLVEGHPFLKKESNQYLFFLEQELKKKNLNPKFIDVILREAEKMDSSFEEPTSKDYCLHNGAKFDYLGDFDKSQPAFRRIFEAKKNAEGYAQLTLEHFLHRLEYIRKENQRLIDKAWEEFKKIEKTDEEENFALKQIDLIYQTLGLYGGVGSRDKQMEAKLRSVIDYSPHGRIAAVIGYNHNLDDPHDRTLYRRMLNDNQSLGNSVQRVFLYD